MLSKLPIKIWKLAIEKTAKAIDAPGGGIPAAQTADKAAQGDGIGATHGAGE